MQSQDYRHGGIEAAQMNSFEKEILCRRDRCDFRKLDSRLVTLRSDVSQQEAS
jgi:hypothetical protein